VTLRGKRNIQRPSEAGEASKIGLTGVLVAYTLYIYGWWCKIQIERKVATLKIACLLCMISGSHSEVGAITQRVVVMPYRLFDTTYRSHFQGSFEDGTDVVPKCR